MDEVHFTLTANDYWHLQLHALSRRLRSRRIILLFCLIVILCALLLPILLSSGTPANVPLTLLIMLTIDIFLFAFILGFAIIIIRLNVSGATRSLRNKGVHIISINEQGLKQKNEQSDSLIYWRAFKVIEADKHNLYFQVDNPGPAIAVVLIPKRAFEGPSQAERFIEHARGYWHK